MTYSAEWKDAAIKKLKFIWNYDQYSLWHIVKTSSLTIQAWFEFLLDNELHNFPIFLISTLQDILTDLNAEGEPLPIRPVNEEWMGHKVFYILNIKSYYAVLISQTYKDYNQNGKFFW